RRLRNRVRFRGSDPGFENKRIHDGTDSYFDGKNILELKAFGGQRGKSEIGADVRTVLADGQIRDSCRDVECRGQDRPDVAATRQLEDRREDGRKGREPHRIYRLRS